MKKINRGNVCKEQFNSAWVANNGSRVLSRVGGMEATPSSHQRMETRIRTRL